MKKKQNKVFKNEQVPENVVSTPITTDPLTQKEESIKQSVHLKKVKQNKKLTGKSKEYINSLGHKGCPAGRRKGKCGCTLINSKKSLNIKKYGGQNKTIDILKDEPLVVEEFDQKYEEITEMGDEDVIKDFEVILLKE